MIVVNISIYVQSIYTYMCRCIVSQRARLFVLTSNRYRNDVRQVAFTNTAMDCTSVNIGMIAGFVFYPSANFAEGVLSLAPSVCLSVRRRPSVRPSVGRACLRDNSRRIRPRIFIFAPNVYLGTLQNPIENGVDRP